MNRNKFFNGSILAAVIIVFFFSCDNTLELTDTSGDQFSVYGVLEMNKDLNVIRIKDLKLPVDEAGNEPIDAEVILHNVTLGVSEVLKDSVVYFDGVATYNFYTGMEITPESEFLLTITRQNGDMISATARSPNLVEFQIDETNAGCRTDVEVLGSPIKTGSVVSYISVLYEGAGRRARAFESNEGNLVRHNFNPQQVLDEIWKDWALGGIDCYRLCYEDPRPQCWQLDTDSMYVDFEHFGPELLESDTGGGENINDGTGKFGIMRTGEFSFSIDSTRMIPARPLPLPFCQAGCPVQ